MNNWRKYAEKYYNLMAKNFFVSIDDMGLSDEEKKIIDDQAKEYNKGKELAYMTPNLQLMTNIAEDILATIKGKWEIVKKHAPEKEHSFWIKEFNELSFEEKHFIIMWWFQGYASGNSGMRLIAFISMAFHGYKMIKAEARE